MKTIYGILIAATLLGSCRSLKEKESTNYSSDQTQLNREVYQSLFEWTALDSTDRYWYYRSDSSFYFHPDSGLYGREGVLWGRSLSLRQVRGQQSWDSASFYQRSDEAQYSSHKTRVRDRNISWVWIGVGGVLSAVLLVRCWLGRS